MSESTRRAALVQRALSMPSWYHTIDLGDGRFEVEGMLFSMPGWWVVNVHVETAAGTDQATFNFQL